jgi:hypothetical protein
VLNLASNNLDEVVLAAGWRSKDDDGYRPWVGPEGQEQDEKPGKPEGIIAIANAIPDMGALTKLIFCGDEWFDGQQFTTPEPATLEVGMAEADFSNKGLQVAGAIIVAAWMSHKDMGALIKLDISSNNIGGEQEGELQRICVASGIELAK